jgi:hypothetical protein
VLCRAATALYQMTKRQAGKCLVPRPTPSPVPAAAGTHLQKWQVAQTVQPRPCTALQYSLRMKLCGFLRLYRSSRSRWPLS